MNNCSNCQGIGGYFELELANKGEYYPGAIKLNSGRHCFEYILRLRGYRKVYVPYYTCEVVLEPIKKLGLEYEFYGINESLEPTLGPDYIDADECFIYTNYFGLKDAFIRAFPHQNNIIIDNSQAFYNKPCPHFDTFYSPRKYFGVPDGGYLITYDGAQLTEDLPQSVSYQRCSHLLKRIDLGAEAGYIDFKDEGHQLSTENMMQMSNLTERILSSIDYEQAKLQRITNFKLYHEHLRGGNMFPIAFFYDENTVPLVYPYLTEDKGLRGRLISKRIFVPQYWSNVLEWSLQGSLEHRLTAGVIPLPIDQRYREADLRYVLKAID